MGVISAKNRIFTALYAAGVIAVSMASASAYAADGKCAQANGQTFTTAPTTQRCVGGYANLMNFTETATGWTWSCKGDAGGAIAQCSAFKPSGGTSGSGTTTVRINAAGPSFTDSKGMVWNADKNFVGGRTDDYGAIAIANTTDDKLYQTERFALTGYSIPVSNGTYTVNLGFAENWFTASGARVFNMNVEGQAVNNFDIFAVAGGKSKAYTRTFSNVAVSDGVLNINFTNVKDYAMVNAIEVLPAGSGGGTNPPVNGACGSANGVAVASKPTSGLCSAGTASTVSGTGPWTWTCSGANGGSTASCSAPLQQASGGTVVTYPVASGVPQNPDFVVEVGGKTSPVYQAKVATADYYVNPPATVPNEPVGFTNFESNGSVSVKVTVKNRTVNSVVVKPTSKGVKPTVSGNVITMTLPGPGQYSVEVNGVHKGLLVFVNPIDTNIPTNGASGVQYFGPGEHTIGVRDLPSNTTVYISGGAIVHGGFKIIGKQNVTIRGRGILDGSKFKQFESFMIHPENSSNVKIEGITILDSPGWTMPGYYDNNYTVDNVKVIGYRQNSDGMSCIGCNNAVFRNSFIRTYDDGVVIKSYENHNIDTVLVEKMVIWNDIGGGALQIGHETETPTIKNITYRNIDIINSGAWGALGMELTGSATVSNVLYDDIRIENHTGLNFINVEIFKNEFSQTNTRANVNGVTYNNVRVLNGPSKPSKLSGFSSAYQIQNVKFQNLNILGKKITNASDMYLSTNAYVKNVTFQ